MAEFPYMPLFPEKFFADTLSMSWDARAVYLELIALAWNRGGTLPSDQNQLRRMIGCRTQTWRRLWQQIEPFWTLGEDGNWHQKRLDREWRRAQKGKTTRSFVPQSDSLSSQPDGKKRSKINGNAEKTRARDRAHNPQPTQTSLPYGRETSGGAASLRVQSHATPPRENEEEPSLDPAAQKRIADGLASLARELAAKGQREAAQEKLLGMVVGTPGDTERMQAQAKLDGMLAALKPKQPPPPKPPPPKRRRRMNGAKPLH